MARSNVGCNDSGRSAISSRNSVPPSAASNSPGTGPPTLRSTPNSSRSSSSTGRIEQSIS
jgi:hypothetical protein